MTAEGSRPIWPLRLAASEGLSTARSGRWTSLLIVIALTWCIAAPAAADALSVSDLVAGEQAWIEAGGHVLVVKGANSAEGANPVPAAVCDRLPEIDGVIAAFALKGAGGARGGFDHIPGGRAPIFEVTPGAMSFFGSPPTSDPAVIVTSGLAERTGVRDGESVRLVRTEGLVASPRSGAMIALVADSAVMGEVYDGALLVPTPLTGNADVCFVRTDAAHKAAVESLLPTLLAHEGQPAIAQPRLLSSQFTVDYTHAYEERAFRWLWIPTAALLLLIWMITQWFRRSQLAIYTTFGMGAASRQVMQVTEWAVLAAFALPWGWALGVVWSLALGAAPETAIAQVSAHAALTVLAASAGVVIFSLRPTGSLLDALKDRN